LTRNQQLITGAITILALIGMLYVLHPKNKLDKIKHTGTLHVLTRIDPTTYFKTNGGYAGLEYDLVMLFAEQLGVKVEFEVPATFPELLEKISRCDADIAAAGLTITQERQTKLHFAPAYHSITEQVVYRSDHRRPRTIEDLNRGILEVGQDTSHVDTLLSLKQKHPELTWEVNKSQDTNGLLYLLHEGLIDYAVADSNQILLIRRYYPTLNIAFNISKPRHLAWALPKSEDTSLHGEVKRFFQQIHKDKTLAQLIEKHYGHANSLNYVDNCTFREHKKSRLPIYQKHFNQAAQKYDLDWRLLAAIGYQESHWLENAVSPTGVEGIMMLTNDTAKLLDIKDRKNPILSIFGGARYFKQRIQVTSDSVPEPDRTWFALASYNVGTGHLEDARKLTQQQGGDPNKWLDVKKRLPLLADAKWYEQTEYGYARGDEPVQYVENIRGYYDLLVWLTEENQIKKKAMQPEKEIDKTETAETIPVNLY
jgi:membrane-bound lytic murein transglycosylase F